MAAFTAGKLTATILNDAIKTLLTDWGAKATITTQQTTTGTSYTDLATVGPQVTINSSGTLALVLFAANFWNGSAGSAAACSVAVSGATTTAASDVYKLSGLDTGTGNSLGLDMAQFAALTITPGSNTYTMKYRVVANTGTFQNRQIFVWAP